VTAGNRRASQFLDQLPGPQLVRRVANAEIAGDGESLDPLLARQDCLARGVLIKRSDLVAQPIVAARQVDDIVGGQLTFEAVLVHQFPVIADQQQADAAPLALGQGVRRQGCRQRDQGNVLRRNSEVTGDGRVENGADRSVDAQ